METTINNDSDLLAIISEYFQLNKKANKCLTDTERARFEEISTAIWRYREQQNNKA
jgi:hypothetical protein